MDDLQLFRGDTVLVKSKYERDTVLIVTTNDNASDGCAQINRIVRQNLQMEPGDYITVEPLADIKYAKRIRVLPLADTIQGQTGSLFDDFLRPYFQEAYRPVRAGDFFTCTGAKGTVEFKIVETDPPEYGIVAPDTLIQCESVPIQRESHRGTKHGGPG
jgi:transitional endoplasmic reticulum ATPase